MLLLFFEWEVLQLETQKGLSCGAQEIGENVTNSPGGRSGLADQSGFPFPLSGNKDMETFSY